MILAIDPSSTVIGWACLQAPQELLEGGIIRPLRAAAPPLDRIRGMLADVRELLDTFVPDDIIVEVTSGKVALSRHHGHGAGLGVYGMAVGAVWCACEAWATADAFRHGVKSEVYAIPENFWTRTVPKTTRTAAIASVFPRYAPASDPGGDLADAIGLGLWFLRERAVCPQGAGS